jgi:hypothetical protein
MEAEGRDRIGKEKVKRRGGRRRSREKEEIK